MRCPLCKSVLTEAYCQSDTLFFFHCRNCYLVFKHPDHLPSAEIEKERYLLHENDVTDEGYRNFVTPLVNLILKRESIDKTGLDFGAGPGPVVSTLLTEKGYSLTLYDPFFYPEKNFLTASYDFIVCCEVIEHFHDPDREFELLRKLLKKDGTLYCMTELHPAKGDFKNWYYQRDPTHVVFYSEKNIDWIKKNYDFSKVTINDRLIVFEA
jgi:SAM-dependent methyltransferase